MISMPKIANKISALFFTVSILLASSVAEGVTLNTDTSAAITEAGEGLTVGIVARADADIQIRRIKVMMAASKTDTDKEIEQLEKLQKILHGQN